MEVVIIQVKKSGPLVAAYTKCANVFTYRSQEIVGSHSTSTGTVCATGRLAVVCPANKCLLALQDFPNGCGTSRWSLYASPKL